MLSKLKIDEKIKKVKEGKEEKNVKKDLSKSKNN